MLRLIATIWKCPNFLPEMSGILDTRIPTYCNSASWYILVRAVLAILVVLLLTVGKHCQLLVFRVWLQIKGWRLDKISLIKVFNPNQFWLCWDLTVLQQTKFSWSINMGCRRDVHKEKVGKIFESKVAWLENILAVKCAVHTALFCQYSLVIF